MPLELGVWRIDKKLTPVSPTKLDQEVRLEDFIHDDIQGLIRDDLMVIGRQVRTAHGHYIDLLAINAEGSLTVLELKKDKTPRDVVAQTLDYGLWVKDLSKDDLSRIFSEYQKKYRAGEAELALDAAFEKALGGQIPEAINQSHELVIVAAELDGGTERIIEYLEDYEVPVNAVFFRVFKDGDREYLTRAWLRDPSETQAKTEEAQARQKGKEPWNGTDFYVSFGGRNWDDAMQFGFVSAGGRRWFTRTLDALRPGHRVFVCIPGKGYVGVGTVDEPAVPVDQFLVPDASGKQVPISTMPLRSKEILQGVGDPEKVERLVRVKWIKTVPLAEFIWESGLFANQNSACKLRSRFTIERLTERFGLKPMEG